MIRVLIGEDSSTVRFLLSKILESDPNISVVGQAKNGAEVVDLARVLKPDLITMDIRMPLMNGFEATKEIMSNNPCPILVISSSVNDDDLNIAFNAIHYGALDIVEKPRQELNNSYDSISKRIIRKVKILSEIKVLHRRFSKFDKPFSSIKSTDTIPKLFKSPYSIVGIVASTGGPIVLKEILSKIPKNFPHPICIVQHIAHGFGKGLVNWLDEFCELTVKFGEDREYLQPGTVYFAPDDYHIEVTEYGTIKIHQEESRFGLRPCGDTLLSSIGFSYKAKGVGIILTGMGSDGAYGMQMLNEFGGMSIAQNEETCMIYGMPKEAITGDCIQKVLSPKDITNFLVNLI